MLLTLTKLKLYFFLLLIHTITIYRTYENRQKNLSGMRIAQYSVVLHRPELPKRSAAVSTYNSTSMRGSFLKLTLLIYVRRFYIFSLLKIRHYGIRNVAYYGTVHLLLISGNIIGVVLLVVYYIVILVKIVIVSWGYGHLTSRHWSGLGFTDIQVFFLSYSEEPRLCAGCPFFSFFIGTATAEVRLPYPN